MTESLGFKLINTLKQGVFWSIHIGCFAVIWAGVSWTAALVCFALYFVRMFAITGGYHRYFSHRSYKTSRPFQFILAYLGAASAQKGPLWWAAHHRHHHQHSDTDQDIHSAREKGVWWSHVGWVLSAQYIEADMDSVRDLTKYPELRFLDRNHLIAPISLIIALYLFGEYLAYAFPGLHTNGFQLFVWGFCVSTTLLYHGTFLINSACHIIGKQRFVTGDDSRNNLILALITLGEGWHNNHHRYPGSEKQGFYWWEIDLSHYVLTFLSWIGLVWDLRVPPERIYEEAKKNEAMEVTAARAH